MYSCIASSQSCTNQTLFQTLQQPGEWNETMATVLDDRKCLLSYGKSLKYKADSIAYSIREKKKGKDDAGYGSQRYNTRSTIIPASYVRTQKPALNLKGYGKDMFKRHRKNKNGWWWWWWKLRVEYRDKIVVMKIMIMTNDSAYVVLVCGVDEWSVKYVLTCELKSALTRMHEHTYTHTYMYTYTYTYTPHTIKEGVREWTDTQLAASVTDEQLRNYLKSDFVQQVLCGSTCSRRQRASRHLPAAAADGLKEAQAGTTSPHQRMALS